MILNSVSRFNDPEPWVHDECPHFDCPDLGKRSNEWSEVYSDKQPRPEFANESNSLLVSFRNAFQWGSAEFLLGMAEKYSNASSWLEVFEPRDINTEELGHATRVMSKYAAVFGSGDSDRDAE